MVPVRNILVARDLADASDAPLSFALACARQHGARIHIVYGALQPGDPDNVPPEAELPDEVFLETLRASTPVSTEELEVQFAVSRGVSPVQALLRYATDQQVDLIVTGSRNHSALRRLLGRSLSQQLARTAPCPVTIVREEARA
ncbi:MAG: hypothetical protein KatS3mg050_4774 [Litorilinea sp.]|nr:MAG: hypothetical protein KatS3mg050_4774 [Litorilinea sp.]